MPAKEFLIPWGFGKGTGTESTMMPGSRKRTGQIAPWFRAWSPIPWVQISAVELVTCMVLGGLIFLSINSPIREIRIIIVTFTESINLGNSHTVHSTEPVIIRWIS